MGRHRYLDRPVRQRVNIPESIYSQVHAVLYDPLTQKPTHGAISTVVTTLLSRWLSGEITIPGFPIPSVDLSHWESTSTTKDPT